MRQNLVNTLLWLLLSAIAQPLAANPSAEFYLNLQRRGVSAFEAARYQEAVDQLRIAAFGMVDDLPLYSKTQVYLTIAYDQLTQPERALDAARRVLAAERISRSYARVAISDPLRSSFEGLAARLLTPSEFAYLTEPVSRTTAAIPAGTTRATAAPGQARPVPQATPPPRQTATRQQATPATPPAAATQPPPAAASAPAQKPAPLPATAQTPASSQAAPTTPPSGSTAAQSRAASAPPEKTASQRQAASTPPPASTQAASTTASPSPASSGAAKPAQPAPTPSSTPPAAQPARTDPAATSTTVNVPAELQAAEQFLTTADMAAARKIYRQLLAYPALSHREQLRVAEGLYRSRDFEGTLAAFERIGTLQPGEEPYRYYIAVASYETGRHAEARRALTQALPYIQITSDVVRYRTLIEAAAD
ncbi:MAG TPA: hypothetical protein VF701_06505 [Thermoanaerobaculia bacterium]